MFNSATVLAGNPQVTMQDLESFSGFSLETLGQRTQAKVQESAGRNPRFEAHYRRDYHIPDDLPLAVGLEQRAAGAIAQYRQALPGKILAFRQQAEDCYALAYRRGYLTAADDYTIVITDAFLHRGLPRPDAGNPRRRPNSFNPEDRQVFIEYVCPNRVLAHEVGHALSHSRPEGRIGFCQLERGGEPHSRQIGNRWFNEGVTVLWEEIAVNDGSTIPPRDDPGDFYYWYRQAAQLIMDAAHLDHNTVLCAYFGNRDARAAVASAIQGRFRCTLDDLTCLNYRTRLDFTARVIGDETIELKITKTTHPSVVQDIQKLATIFPNVQVRDTRSGDNTP